MPKTLTNGHFASIVKIKVPRMQADFSMILFGGSKNEQDRISCSYG